MKLVVLGASRVTGQAVIARALAQGHEVTTFARHRETLASLQEQVMRQVTLAYNRAASGEASKRCTPF